MKSSLQQLYLKPEDVPKLPGGWRPAQVKDIADVLKPGKLYDENNVADEGDIPVVNQSADDFHGFHSEEAGVLASEAQPVSTFANHTCAMRLMKRPFSCIQNIFPRIGKAGVCDTVFFHYATLGRVSLSGYKGHHPIYRDAWIPLPPLPQQIEIGRTVSAYDELMENNRRRMELLEESARLLYREWFVRLRFPGHEHTRLTHGLPQGWEKKTLGELANVTMGQSPESKFYNEAGDGLPFHQGVADFGDRFVTNRIYTTALNRLANAGDILCSVRAPVGRLNITLDKIVIGRGLAALRSRTGNQSFLFHQLRTHFFKEDLIGSGAIFASVTKAEFENQKMLTPPKKFVHAFEDVSVPIDEQLRVLHLQNQKLRVARDLLLPRLMSGEIAV